MPRQPREDGDKPAPVRTCSVCTKEFDKSGYSTRNWRAKTDVRVCNSCKSEKEETRQPRQRVYLNVYKCSQCQNHLISN